MHWSPGKSRKSSPSQDPESQLQSAFCQGHIFINSEFRVWTSLRAALFSLPQVPHSCCILASLFIAMRTDLHHWWVRPTGSSAKANPTPHSHVLCRLSRYGSFRSHQHAQIFSQYVLSRGTKLGASSLRDIFVPKTLHPGVELGCRLILPFIYS